MKAVDSNLLAYASIAGHPAADACEHLLAAHSAWVTGTANLIELHRVLTGVYGVAREDADARFHQLCDALHVEALTPEIAEAALDLRVAHGIDLNDAILLDICSRRGIAVLATDDGSLATACRTLGITPENPIGDDLRREMAVWEADALPPKGIPRILAQVHRWIRARDAGLAGEFHSQTESLSRMV